MSEEQIQDGAAPAGPTGLQRLIMWAGFGTGVLALVLGGVAIAWQYNMQQRMEGALAEVRAGQQDLQASVAGLDTRISEREEASVAFQERIDRLATRLSAVDVSDADNAVVRLQRILIRQERDYRDFLSSLERSLGSLDRVIPRSGGWWSEFATELEELQSLSEARENYVFTLREP